MGAARPDMGMAPPARLLRAGWAALVELRGMVADFSLNQGNGDCRFQRMMPD